MLDIAKDLEAIGFSQNEASVYLAALSVGKGTIQEIARKADVKRVTTYGVMESLMEQGLASSVTEGKKQYFMAESPDRVVDFIEKQKHDFEGKAKKIRDALPQLKELHQKESNEPVVKYYSGKEGILAMVKDLLSIKKGEDIWMAYPVDEVVKLLNDEERQSIRFTRGQKDITVHALYTTAGEDIPQTKTSIRKRVDHTEFPFEADIAVYGNKVRLASLGQNPMGVVIENRDIANTMRSILKIAWQDK